MTKQNNTFAKVVSFILAIIMFVFGGTYSKGVLCGRTRHAQKHADLYIHRGRSHRKGRSRQGQYVCA